MLKNQISKALKRAVIGLMFASGEAMRAGTGGQLRVSRIVAQPRG